LRTTCAADPLYSFAERHLVTLNGHADRQVVPGLSNLESGNCRLCCLEGVHQIDRASTPLVVLELPKRLRELSRSRVFAQVPSLDGFTQLYSCDFHGHPSPLWGIKERHEYSPRQLLSRPVTQ
jgi:hypothetical protein